MNQLSASQTVKIFDALTKQTDQLEHDLLFRMQRSYSKALTKSLKKFKGILKKVQDVHDGKLTAPSFYNTPELVEQWKVGFMQQLFRQGGMAQTIADDVRSVNVVCSDALKESMQDIYRLNLEGTVATIRTQAASAGIKATFSQYDKRQISTILEQNQSVFSKIAYSKYENAADLTEKLQDQLIQATVNGESQREIIKRIREVTGYEYKRGKRIAQTERTRVQSAARYQAAHEAAEQGISVANEWSTRFVNSRETHELLDGNIVYDGDEFELDDGDRLRYPGDPRGRACNVINCHCALIPHVLLPDESVIDNRIVKVKTDGNQ